MHSFLSRIFILCLLVVFAGFAKAQKNIVISDSLSANAEQLKVKMGGQGFGKIWKFSFGEYGIVSSKMGWQTISTKGNFFNTKTESKSTQKFSFVLSNKAGDTARVNAADNIMVQSMHSIEISTHFWWGSDEIVYSDNNFSAFITFNGDTTETWALFMNFTGGSKTLGSNKAYLSNGERKISISPASSNKNGTDTRSIPAMGYEFIENGQSLCALQYYGGGLLGLNKNIIWINNSQDVRMKLTLAAAMTAVLQIKVNQQTGE